MAENVGGIFYTVSADTKPLIDQTRAVDRETAKMAASFNVITAAIKVMAVAMAAVQFAKMADEMRLLSSRVEVAAGSIEKGAAAMRDLISISTRTQTAVAANAQVFQRLNGSLLQMGGTQADTLRVTELLGMAIKVSGASATETSSAMLQFGQALGSGKLAGDELRSLLENAPYLMRQLADGLGVPIGALKKMGEEGKLTADAVVNALGKAAAKIETDFAKMPQTLAATWQVAMDQLSRLVLSMDNAAGTSDALAGVTKGVGEVFDSLATRIARASDESDKLGRNDKINDWAKATTTVLSYVADAADFVRRAFQQAGIGLGGMAASAAAVARGDFSQARDIMRQVGTDIMSISSQTYAGVAIRQQAAALATGTDGSDPMDRRARGGVLSSLTGGGGGGGKGKKKAPVIGNADYAASLAAQQAIQDEASELGRKFIEKQQQDREKADEDRRRAQELAVTTMVGGDPVARLQLELQRKSEALNTAAQADMENAELYASAKIALEEQTAEQIARIRQREADQQAALNIVAVGMMGDMAGQLYAVLEKSGRERTALGKALFLSQKALAVAEIIMNAEKGAAVAYGMGPFGIPMAAYIRASGYASAGIVAGLAVSEAFGGGRQYGGPASAGSMYRVNETGRPEMFTAANGNQFLLPTSGGRVTAADKVGGGSVQVVVNNYTGADVQASASDDGRVITIAVRQAVAEVAGQISSHSGNVWSAMRGATNVQARLG